MKLWEQFYIEQTIKRAEPYRKGPGWAFDYVILKTCRLSGAVEIVVGGA